MKPTSCGVLIRNSITNKYLLCGYTFNNSFPKFLGIPKGRVNDGESFEECARRELFEETGIVLDCKIIHLLDYSNKSKNFVVYYAEIDYNPEFSCSTLTEKGDKEINFWNWYNLEDALKLTKNNHSFQIFSHLKRLTY